MRNGRQTTIRRALLSALEQIPHWAMLPELQLRLDAARLVPHTPTTSELDREIREADAARLVVGLPTEDTVKWKITDAGRAWLIENP